MAERDDCPEPGFADRLQTAAKAKQAQLDKIRATALANATQSAERQTARVETAEARQIRTAERKNAQRVAGMFTAATCASSR